MDINRKSIANISLLVKEVVEGGDRRPVNEVIKQSISKDNLKTLPDYFARDRRAATNGNGFNSTVPGRGVEARKKAKAPDTPETATDAADGNVDGLTGLDELVAQYLAMQQLGIAGNEQGESYNQPDSGLVSTDSTPKPNATGVAHLLGM